MKIAKRLDQAPEKKFNLRDQLVTIGDLEQFRAELLHDFKQLLSTQPSAPEKKWLKSNEVRKLLKISAGTLQNLRYNGSLNYSKVGGIIFYRHDDIYRMLEVNSVTLS